MSIRISAENQGLYASADVPNGAFTITWWGYLSVDRNAYSTMIEPGATSGTSLYMQVGTNATGQRLVAAVDGTDPWSDINTTRDMPVGGWCCFALTQESQGGSFSLHHGTDPAALTIDTGNAPDDVFPRFRIGWSVWGGEWFNGRIASLKHWASVLSNAEIADELLYWQAVKKTDLVRRHDWRFGQAFSLVPDEGIAGNLITNGANPTIEADPPSVSDLVVADTTKFFLSYM